MNEEISKVLVVESVKTKSFAFSFTRTRRYTESYETDRFSDPSCWTRTSSSFKTFIGERPVSQESLLNVANYIKCIVKLRWEGTNKVNEKKKKKKAKGKKGTMFHIMK